MGRKNENYNIGLDIGTNSVGWCVTNNKNEILKFKGKRMWGVRLFDAGDTAANTRTKRGQRRRYMRRKERIRLLQELVGEMIRPVDENFYIRLEDGFLWKEDKRIDSKYTLFADKSYTDKEYYKEFPTIYHLRNYLMNSQAKADPRHIYLALHHMIKYRGNFLYPGQSFNVSERGIKEGLGELMVLLQNYNEGCFVGEIDTAIIVEKLGDKKLSKKNKQDEITKQLIGQGVDKKLASELAKAILGYSFEVTGILGDKAIVDDNGKAVAVKFSDAKYEEQVEGLEAQLQERFEVIEKLHVLYSQNVLSDILSGKQYISEAMLEKYRKHHEDLSVLKTLIRKYAPNKYSFFFRQELDKSNKAVKNYVNYILGDKKCNQEELYKTIKTLLTQADEADEAYQYCKNEMSEYLFLVRLNGRENSSIPWQMNQEEMKKILAQQEVYYPVLKENREKILSLLSFKIPYYVGPLNPKTSSRFAWIKRTEEKIYPWNFFDVINEDETAEGFITRMTNYCTYLPTEKVVPKYSLLYSKYCVLDELANLRINERKLEPEDKKKIINDIFLHTKRVTNQRLCDWLKKEQWGGQTEFKVTGYQKENEFASSLGTYIDFYKIFGRIDESNRDMIEQIIYWLTVFEEKSIIKKKIKENYKQITDRQLKSILKLRYKGWARFSRKLLTGLVIKQDEMAYSIMDYLENTKLNFMQIIKDKEIGFAKLIEKEQIDLCGQKIGLEHVKELQGSPAIKKGVWQTVKIIQEIHKYMGYEPTNIMLEFARNDEESKRTKDRKSKLVEAFNKLKEEVDEYNSIVIEQLNDKKYSDKLASEKLFLYFIQNGKCMYTGRELEIEHLDKYEVDHIIPRCYIKDDSLENKVLVIKEENQRKLDNLLLGESVQSKNKVRWEKLYKHGLIGWKKYNNLMRSGLSENEQKGFINRQLVETRQICKHVAVLLQGSYVNSNVITVKAEIGYLFREKYNLYKSRNINDFHHAQDAYLSVVIGNTLLLNKECDSAEWIYNDYLKVFKKQKDTRSEKYGYVLSMFDRKILDKEGQVIWDAQSSLNSVVQVFQYKNCLVTKKLEEGTGQFYDETIYGKESGKKDLIPLKQGMDVKKYGGYSGVKNAYSVAIIYRNKKKMEKRLIGIPVQVSYSIKQGKYTLEQYLEKLGYSEVSVLRNRVLKYQLIEENGQLEYITSFQEVCNARQLIVHKEWQQVIYWIDNKRTSELEEHVGALDKLYEYLINKVKDYYQGFENVWTQIDKEIIYGDLRLEDKCNLIQEILKLTKADAQNANLKKVNSKLSDRAGRKQKAINLEGITLIDQSITGLFERRYTF